MKKKNNMHDPKEMRTNSSFLPNISTIHQLLYNLCTVTTVSAINIVPKYPSVQPKEVTKVGLLSEKSGVFLLLRTLQKNIQFHYLKLLHPVHAIYKILIKFYIFKLKETL